MINTNPNFISSLLPGSNALDLLPLQNNREGKTTIKTIENKVKPWAFIDSVEVSQKNGKIIQAIVVLNKQDPNDRPKKHSKTGKSNIFFMHKDNNTRERVLLTNPHAIQSALDSIGEGHKSKRMAKL